jgi:hypothetical protein
VTPLVDEAKPESQTDGFPDGKFKQASERLLRRVGWGAVKPRFSLVLVSHV